MRRIPKKEYEKPAIRKVRLAPEESVLAACKVQGTLKTQSGKCDNLAGACINSQQGS